MKVVLSRFLNACISLLASNPSLCIGISEGARAPPFGLRLLARTGGWPPSLLLSIVWMLGIVWPEVAGAVVEAGAEGLVALG